MNWEYLLTREYQGTPEDLEHCFAGHLVKKMGKENWFQWAIENTSADRLIYIYDYIYIYIYIYIRRWLLTYLAYLVCYGL